MAIREYSEGYGVEIVEKEGRLVIFALNEGGHNGTSVDLLDVLEWVRANKPELLSEK